MFSRFRLLNLEFPIHFVWILEVFLPVLVETTTPHGTIRDKICDNLKNGNGAKLNVLCVGLTQDKLLLITKDFYVYDVEQDSLDDAIDALYLQSKPVPISTKYPELWRDSRFGNIKGSLIFNSFVMIDSSDSAYICMTTKQTETNERGVNYNLQTSKVYQGWIFLNSWDEALISTAETGHFYSIRSSNGASQMNKYSVTDSRPINQSPPPKIQAREIWKTLCWQNSAQKDIVARDGGCQSSETPVHWSIFRGFVKNQKFYLFGDTNVIIFSEDVYDSGQPRSVTTKSYSSFFYCPGEVPPSDRSDYLGLIILLIVLLLTLLGLLLSLFFWLVRRRRRRPRKDNLKGHNDTGKNTVKDGFYNLMSGGSIRSSGQGIFGFLTKMSGGEKSSGSKFKSHGSAVKTFRTGMSNNKGAGKLTYKTQTRGSKMNKSSKKKSGKKKSSSRKSGKSEKKSKKSKSKKSKSKKSKSKKSGKKPKKFGTSSSKKQRDFFWK